MPLILSISYYPNRIVIIPKRSHQTITHGNSHYTNQKAKRSHRLAKHATKSNPSSTINNKCSLSTATSKKSPFATNNHTKKPIGSGSFDEFDGWLVQSDSSNRKDCTKTKMLIIPPSKNGTPINADKDWMKHLIGCTEEAEKLNLSLHCELISRHSTALTQ